MELDFSELMGTVPQQIEQTPKEKAEEQRQEMYSYYQSNIQKAAQLQGNILKGVSAGQDIYTLFLQASEVISLMTDNKPFIEQIKADIVAVYGLALEEKTPLKTALEIVQGKIDKLTLALQQESICEADKKRITTALQKINQEKEYIKSKQGQA